jgi:hypothetical protein
MNQNPDYLFQPFRYCTNHMGMAKTEGGIWRVASSGKTRRWVCAACLQRKREKRPSNEL